MAALRPRSRILRSRRRCRGRGATRCSTRTATRRAAAARRHRAAAASATAAHGSGRRRCATAAGSSGALKAACRCARASALDHSRRRRCRGVALVGCRWAQASSPSLSSPGGGRRARLPVGPMGVLLLLAAAWTLYTFPWKTVVFVVVDGHDLAGRELPHLPQLEHLQQLEPTQAPPRLDDSATAAAASTSAQASPLLPHLQRLEPGQLPQRLGDSDVAAAAAGGSAQVAPQQQLEPRQPPRHLDDSDVAATAAAGGAPQVAPLLPPPSGPSASAPPAQAWAWAATQEELRFAKPDVERAQRAVVRAARARQRAQTKDAALTGAGSGPGTTSSGIQHAQSGTSEELPAAAAAADTAASRDADLAKLVDDGVSELKHEQELMNILVAVSKEQQRSWEQLVGPRKRQEPAATRTTTPAAQSPRRIDDALVDRAHRHAPPQQHERAAARGQPAWSKPASEHSVTTVASTPAQHQPATHSRSGGSRSSSSSSSSSSSKTEPLPPNKAAAAKQHRHASDGKKPEHPLLAPRKAGVATRAAARGKIKL
eukprot:scaffold218_cov333-Prasinococcus_capsulatus_cf.AAC.10